jgi:hypothetical protein
MTRATCAVGITPYDAVDFDWFEGMDAFNVRLFGLALRGEELLVPELEREAADRRERVAADPANVIGEEVKLPAVDRAELARTERHEIIRQSVSEAFRNGIWGWVDDDLCFTDLWEASTSQRSARPPESFTGPRMFSCPGGTASGLRATSQTRKSWSTTSVAISTTLTSSPSVTAGW